MRIVTDSDALKAHIEAEIHAADWATPTERKQVSKVANAIIERLNRPEKVSDITGFPEDDISSFDMSSIRSGIDAAEQEVEEATGYKSAVPRYRRRVPGLPKEL